MRDNSKLSTQNSKLMITIIDVSPRDGLQNEPEVLSVGTKVALIERLLEAGLPRVEIGSFVNPKQVPQMAGTGEVAAKLAEAGGRKQADSLSNQEEVVGLNKEPASSLLPSTLFTCLVPNARGYELAREAGMHHVRLVLAASESLNQANFKRSVEESLADFATIIKQAHVNGEQVSFGVAIGASFGCPFEGYVPPERVMSIARQLAGFGVSELILADTTGMAVPTQVERLSRDMLRLLHDGPEVTIHLHNTRNTGYANAYAAWQAGVRHFDASLGGIGGCPFAPRAVGNIATEDLVHMFNGMGVPTGIDLPKLLAASAWLGEQMGKGLPGLVAKAGAVYSTITA
jgi:(R)-citramalyl-CoA lyase